MRNCLKGCFAGHLEGCDEIETHKACAPAPAEHGYLCERCFVRLNAALGNAEGIIYHLRTIYNMPFVKLSDGSQKNPAGPREPLNLTAWELADNIHQAITGHKIPVGEPAVKTAARTRHIVNAVKEINYENDQEFVERTFKLASWVNGALNLFPIDPAPMPTVLPCPECNHRTMLIPPNHPGDEATLKCTKCAFIVPDDKIGFYLAVAKRKEE